MIQVAQKAASDARVQPAAHQPRPRRPTLSREVSDSAIRLLLVDDREVVLRGLLQFCEAWCGRLRIWCVADLMRACTEAANVRPHIAVVGERLTAPDGGSLASALARASPGTTIVLMTDGPTTQADRRRRPVVSLRQSGTQLIKTVLSAAGEDIKPHVMVGTEALTVRERLLLQGLAAGETNAEIARRLCLSRSTIKQQAATLYRKLGVRNRAGAAVEAARRGWIE